MIRIYGVRLSDLREKANAIRTALPASILDPWQSSHPSLRNEDSLIASLAGVWLLWKSGANGTLVYTENGKPSLTTPNRAISITHTKTYAFCAISSNNDPIGLDAEDFGRLTPDRFSALTERWFNKTEQDEFLKTPTEEVFLNIWTRKEAFVKLTGEGLGGICKTDTSSHAVTTYRIGNTILTLAHPHHLSPSEQIEIFTL